jgi:outer membrane receptor protein involved in Fe transport
VRDPAGIVPNASDDSFRCETISAYGVFSLTERFDISLGAEAIFEQGSSKSELIIGGVALPSEFNLDRQVYAPYAEARVNLPVGLVLEGGLRIDLPRGFDAELSPRFGLRQTFEATGTALTASWGEGFKLPSIFALGNPIVGNADLGPETSESVEVGVEQRFWRDHVDLRVAYFHNRFFDLVDFEEGPPPRLVNRSEVTAEGFEVTVDLRPTQTLALAGHLTYTSTDIEGTAEELRNRPEWRAGGSALWHPRPDLAITLDALYVGEVLDSSIATGDRTLDPYLRFDFAITWTAMPNVELSLALDNLSDADYEEAVGFPAPGIRPRLAVRMKF